MAGPQDYWSQFESEPSTDDYWSQYEEEKKPQPSGGFGSGYGLPSLRDIGTTALKIPGQLGEALVGLGDVVASPSSWMLEKMGYEPGSTLPSKALKGLGYDPQFMEKQISKYESPELKAAKQDFGQAKGFQDTASAIWRNPGLAALSLEESAPYMAVGAGIARPLVKAGFNPVIASAIGEAVPTIGSQASQIRQEQGGEFDLTDAATSLTSGALTGLISLGSGKISEYAGLPDIDKLLADKTLEWRKRLPAYLGGMGTEAIEEGLQSAQEQAATNYATGKPIGEGVIPASVMGAATGGLMGAGTIFKGGTPKQAPTPLDQYKQQEFDFGPPEPTQQQLPFDPVQGPQSQPSKIWPGIDPVTRKFRKIYPEATQQGQLPFEPEADATGQMSLDLGPPEQFPGAGGPRAKPVPPQAPPAGFTPSGPVEEPAGDITLQTGGTGLRNPLEAIGDDKGTADFNKVLETLTQLLGRPPSIQEIQDEMANQEKVLPFPERPSIEDRQVESFHGDFMEQVNQRAAQMQQRHAELKQQYPNVPDEWIQRITTAERNIARHLTSPRVDSPNVQQLIADNQRRIDVLTERMKAYNDAHGGKVLPFRNPLELFGDEEGTADFNKAWQTLQQALGRKPTLPELQQEMDRVNAINPPPEPTTEGEYVPPAGFAGEGESPGRMLTDDTIWRNTANEALIHHMSQGAARRPPAAATQPTMQDQMMGVGLGETIPKVDPTGQQLFPGFGHSDLPPRDVPPEGPYSQPEGDMTQGRLPLHDEKWWQRREQREAARAGTQQVEGLDPEKFNPNFDPDYAATVLRDVPPGPPGLSVTGEGGVISITYRAPDGTAIVDAMVFKEGVLGPGSPATVSSWAADKSRGFLYGRAVNAVKNEFLKMGAVAPTDEYSPDTRNFVNRMNAQQAPAQPTTPEQEESPDMTEEEVEAFKKAWMSREQAMYGGVDTEEDQARYDEAMKPQPPDDEPRFQRSDLPRQPIYPGKKADEGYSTGRELDMEHADDLEQKGDIEGARRAREKTSKMTNEEPEMLLRSIIEDYPNDHDLIRQAREIYKEQDPAKITDNHLKWFEKLNNQEIRDDAWNETRGGPYEKIVALSALAMSKYERTSMRMIHPQYIPHTGPMFAKVKGGGLTVDANIRRMAINITKDYTSPLPGIMNREAVQNALDAIKDMGDDGEIKVKFTSESAYRNTPAMMEVYDNGSGLDETGLAEKLVRIFASGKENEAGATGGKGIGSASYILGGQHFEIDTVAVDSKDGNKYRIIAGGTPDQFLDPNKGSDWKKTKVKADTPTGTVIKVTLKGDQDIYDAKATMKKVHDHSRDRNGRIVVDPDNYSNKHVVAIEPNGGAVEEFKIPASKDDKLIGDFVYHDSDITVAVAPFDPTEDRERFEVHYLNNGMYQFSETKYFEKVKNVPSDVIVNIKPRMDEQDDNYPFINTREDVKKDMREFIQAYVNEHIKDPAINTKKNRTQELYDSMPFINIPGAKRKTSIFDPGERLTKAELNRIVNDPNIHKLVQLYDQLIDAIIQSTGRTNWGNTLEGVGLVFDPNMHGVHIPNPATKKTTILINPFIRMEQGQSPTDNAFNSVITSLHEVAHIGMESGYQTDPIPTTMDMSDPRYAQFYMSLMEQIRTHGDVGWSSTGHGMDFVHRLGEVYAKFGPARTFNAADRLESIFTRGQKSGNYSPEFQELLHIYTTSRGRPETTEDLLSGTGVKQENRESPREGDILDDNGPVGERTPAQENLPGVTQGGRVRAAAVDMPPHAHRVTHQERIARLAEERVAFQTGAKQFEESGDLDRSRRMRAEATKIQNRRDYSTDPTSKAEEFLVRAKYEKYPDRKEDLTNRANKIFYEQAGQLLLSFDPKQDLIDDEFLEQAEGSVDIEDAHHGISHNYAKMILDGTPDGPPGLKVESKWVVGDETNFAVTYRNPAGKPIAYANFTYNIMTDRGNTGILVADKDAGTLYGRALMYVGREIFRRNALEPSGMYSVHTAKLLKRLRKLLADPRIQKFLRDEKGELDISALGTHFDKVMQYVKQRMKTGGLVTQRVMEETKKLIKDDTGAMPIPTWKQVKSATGWGQGKSKPAGPPVKYNPVHEVIMLPAGATTTLDLSAPGRQGLALIHTPQYWKALFQMPRGLINSEFDKIDQQLRAKPIFRPIIGLNGRPGPSLAQIAGIELLVPASSNMPGQRAQQIASRWLETGGFLGPERVGGVINPFRAAYFHSVGYGVRASNRAFITFLNTLRVNRFEYLINRAQNMADIGHRTGRTRMPGIMGGIDLPQIMGGGNIGFKQDITRQQAAELDPYLNHELAREIGDFINTATGAGPLKTHVLPFRQTEINLEKHATLLSAIFFSPGLMASRIRMLNPNTYVMATPQVRREYMKSVLAAAGAWYAIAQMLKMALGDEAEIDDRITSADFGKVRIGDTRLDVGGGFQQFLVNYARAWHGGWTTSGTGEYKKFGEGYRAETQWSNIERFLSNKMNPVVKFAYDVANADQYAPFHVYDRMAQLAIPLYIQDIIELMNEDPLLFPIAAPVALFGGGTQMYGKAESVGKIVDPENDWLAEGGGGIRSLAPWNWNKEDYEMTDFPFQEPE